LETARRAAQKLSVTIDTFEVRNSQGVEPSLRRLIESRPDAALLASDTLLLTERQQIADAMTQNRIPAIYPFREYAEVGGFIMYGANISVLFQRAAEYADRILNSEKPDSGSASDGVRAGHQPESGAGAWVDAAANRAGPRRRGDRMRRFQTKRANPMTRQASMLSAALRDASV
jgi:hypothetical protein